MDNRRIKSDRLWTLPFISLFCINIIINFSFAMLNPIISKYAVSIGATLTLAGAVVGILPITALILRPFSGIVADRYNKKRILTISIAIISFAILGHSVSKVIPILIMFRILHGMAFSVCSTVTIALASELIPKERLGEGLSMFGISMIIAQAIAPSVGLALSSSLGFIYFYIIAALVLALAFVLLFVFPIKLPEQTADNLKRTGFSFKNLIAKECIIIAITSGSFSMINGIVNSFLVLYGESLGIKGIGLYFTSSSIILLLSRVFLGRIIDRVDNKYIVFPALTSMIIGVICLASARSIWMVLIASVFLSLGWGSGQPTMQSSAIKQVGPERRGVATSTLFLGNDLGQSIGPSIGGSISEQYGYSTMYALASIPLAMVMLLFGLYRKFGKKPTSKETTEIEAQ